MASKQLARRFILKMATDPGPGRAQLKKQFANELQTRIGGNRVPWRVIADVPARASGAGNRVFYLVGLRFQGMASDQHAALRRRARRIVARKVRGWVDDSCQRDFGHLNGWDLVCEIEVDAIDSDRAFIVAQELISERLDALAGIAALCSAPTERRTDPRRWGGPRLALELGGERAAGPMFAADAHEVDLTEVIRHQRDPIARLLLRLVTKKQLREGERMLLRALRWLGRSHRAHSEEAAYLYGVIVLETLLKSPNEAGVSKTLRLRYAHLRGVTKEARRKLLGRLEGLYGTRSAIVHARETNVDFGQLAELWGVVNATIGAFVHRRLYLKTEDQIAAWFDEQVL